MSQGILQLLHALNLLAHTHAFAGAMAGGLAAAKTDLSAFTQWRNWHDFATYDWGTATWRWFQGAVIGAGTLYGYFQLVTG